MNIRPIYLGYLEMRVLSSKQKSMAWGGGHPQSSLHPCHPSFPSERLKPGMTERYPTLHPPRLLSVLLNQLPLLLELLALPPFRNLSDLYFLTLFIWNCDRSLGSGGGTDGRAAGGTLSLPRRGCWGWTAWGQLGTPPDTATPGSSPRPVEVGGFAGRASPLLFHALKSPAADVSQLASFCA